MSLTALAKIRQLVFCVGAIAQLYALPLAADPAPMVARDSGSGEVGLVAGAVQEPCLDMAAGERLDYRFSADAPLDFNLHYHEQGRVVFALSQDNVRERSGQYYAPTARRYCLMWTNRGSARAALAYSYRIYQEEERP